MIQIIGVIFRCEYRVKFQVKERLYLIKINLKVQKLGNKIYFDFRITKFKI